MGSKRSMLACGNSQAEKFDRLVQGCAVATRHGDFSRALKLAQQMRDIDPSYAKAHANIGSVYVAFNKYDEAIFAYEKAISIDPGLVPAHLCLATALLVTGNFKRGWREYVWSWRDHTRASDYSYFNRVELWNGESFVGKRLLVTFDQGFGDSIQMLRYLPLIKARGGHVILQVDPVREPMLPLFYGLPGIDELRGPADGPIDAANVDLHIPLWSGTPYALGLDNLSTLPVSPYLWAQPDRIERWRPRLEKTSLPRVGIVWAGAKANLNDRNRSIPFESMSVLGDIDGISWFGLQKGRDEDRDRWMKLKIDPLGQDISDFSDTAAIIAQLDLVISVDTAIVHLAGALGKPVWNMVTFSPDWRWLLDRRDSIWYPTMLLFRQPKPGDWASVLRNVHSCLSKLTKT